MSEPWEILAFAAFAILALVILVRNGLAARRFGVEVERELGEAGGLYVEVLRDARWRRYVGVVAFDEDGKLRCCLQGRAARELAEMLRTAALPGRNLADARFRRRRAHRPW